MVSRRLVVAAAVGLVLFCGAREARAQFICANFWPHTSGTYADQLTVTVSGSSTESTAHGVTGLELGGGATTCTQYTLSQFVARFDFEVVGVDPGEEVWFDINGVEYTLMSGNLFMNPYVTPQPLTIMNGRLRSAAADGSAFAEITAFNMTQLRMCASGGDGVIVSPIINSFCQCANGNKHVNEDCDDGNVTNGDGCSSMCAIEPGWSCGGNPSVCVLGCGDGTMTGGEQCDDGNTMGGDGCTSACIVEGGWSCTGSMPTTCAPFCGDAQLRGGETCDDGNQTSGDGCSPACATEPGWTCTGTGPGSCTMTPIDAGPDAPPIDAPPVDAPPVDAPDIDAPDIDAPDIDAPDVDAPPPVDGAAPDATPVDAPPAPDATPPVDAPPAADAATDLPASDEGCCSARPTPDASWAILLLFLALRRRDRRGDRRCPIAGTGREG